MIALVDEPIELLLAGYVPLARSGFALPCFATHPRPNAWYSARCSIDGDHAGAVAGFDLYDDDQVLSLPEPLQYLIRIGDPWTDVFLWDGDPLVGTAVELVDELRPKLPEMREAMPLSLLELTLAAGEEDLAEVAEAARSTIERDHGATTAAEWRTGLLASQARLAIRKLLSPAEMAQSVASEARQAVVEPQAGNMVVRLPSALTIALGGDRLDRLNSDLGMLGSRLGVLLVLEATVVERHGLRADEPALGEDLVRPLPQRVEPVEAAMPAELRILIACFGERARAIARHISEPDWTPVREPADAARRWRLGRGRAAPREEPSGRSVIDVVNGETPLPSDGDYDVMICLVDDGLATMPRHDLTLVGSRSRDGRRHQAIRLLAPALPTDGPSRLLSSPDGIPTGWHALVDTSLARSPFWTGNPWRAIDRRIADIVVGAALLATIDDRVHEALLNERGRTGLPLLSQAFGRGYPRGGDRDLGLMSESSAFGWTEPRSTEQVFEFDVASWGKSAPGSGHGYAALRDLDGNFAHFAEAVVSSVFLQGSTGLKGGMSRVRRSSISGRSSGRGRIVDKRVTIAGLCAPELAARVGPDGGPSLVVLGEAPTLNSVRSGRDAGVGVARYTDRDTLVDILFQRVPEKVPLPRELRLPNVRRLEPNRRLAVRGVDPRDILRAPRELARDWLERSAGSKLEALYRGYRARIDALEVEEVVLPRAAVEAGVGSGDPAASAFVKIADGRANTSTLKRPSDLAAAWNEPQGGEARRYVIDDGEVPIRIAELPRGIVPAQRMFMIDGDSAVPMLFGSRLFNVWARATTTRSTSWLSRFSVSRTFETLPIPQVFEIVERGGRAELRLRGDAGPMADLVRYFDVELDPGEAGLRIARNGVIEAGEGLIVWDQVNSILLDALELPVGAADIDILDRLLAMNRAASEHGDLPFGPAV